MKLVKLLEYLVERRRTLGIAMLVVMGLLVAVDFLIPPAYTRFPWDSIGGFAAFYGLVSCVLIIIVSKWLGYVLLYRDEGYYDDDE